MPHTISHINSVSPAHSLHSATDSPVSSASPEPSLLLNQDPHLAPLPRKIPDSALPTPSIIDAEDPPAERLTSSTTYSKAQANNKTTHNHSNKYSNKFKAKVHIGTCAIGGITLGILAGPIGVVFAAAYINAMCGTLYGGSKYFTGDKANQPKAEPEPEPLSENPLRHRPHLHSIPSENGYRPDESDSEQERGRFGGQPNATIGSNNFIFAPTVITSPPPTQGLVYFYREDDKNHKPTTGQRISSTQNDNSAQGSLVPEVKVVGVSTLNRQQATTDKPSPIAADVEEFFDSFDGYTALHVMFDDGVNAFVRVPESMTSDILNKHSHLLNRASSTVYTTGKENDQTDAKEVQPPTQSQHYRADGVDQMLDTQADSLKSARLVANKEKPSTTKNGTHSWQQQQQQQQQQQGSLEPKSIDSVNAKTSQQQTTEGLRLKSSSGWNQATENGQVRWVKESQQSLGNEKVLLTAGSVSGFAQNYSRGVLNNVKPFGELKMAHLQRLQNTLKSDNDATRLSVLRSGKLVVVGKAVDEQNLIRA
ncbi:hypothetical protein K8D10_22690 [Aeromonas veronii]|uniref:hypothetical protein n=1 Tax=Aeromonas veronii TaxID=654 RepID=UPI00207CEB10|nr:hypothetical protein [Aeromonas veronii]MCO4174554.1 hypothetical protein [Aeromonas veronii]